MFHSSSSSYGDQHALLPQVCCPTAAGPALNGTSTYGLLDGSGGGGSSSHPLFLASSSPPYSSSFPSYYLHRSSSTHSLSLNHFAPPDPSPHPPPFFSSPVRHPPPPPPQPLSSSPSSSSCDFLDFNPGPVRRVFSTGDLQGMNGLQASADNYHQEGGAAAGKVGRYTAEERKERIERYRSKRHQRNFHKKITYACRKTLADSRPRVRGRFARNGETEVEAETEAAENSYECYRHNHCDQAQNCVGSGAATAGDWWRQMQAALVTEEEEGGCCYDEDLWADFADVFSVNLLS